jgi:hypothetical protein
MWYEPKAFSWKHDRRRSVEVYRQWAEQAWREESVNCPEMAGASDYILGFTDGFVDYVYGGGNGEPPPVPPRHFWNVMLRSPEGKQRADQWFAGYRHGARTARAGGFRDLGTVRSTLFGLGDSGLAEHPHDIYGPNSYLGPEWPGAESMPEPTDTQQVPALNSPANDSADGAGSELEDSPEASEPAGEATDEAEASGQDVLSEPQSDPILPADEPATEPEDNDMQDVDRAIPPPRRPDDTEAALQDFLSDPLYDATSPAIESETEPDGNKDARDGDRAFPKPDVAVSAPHAQVIKLDSPKSERPIADPAVSTVAFVSEAAGASHQSESTSAREPARLSVSDVNHEVKVLPRIIITSESPAKSTAAESAVSKQKTSTIKIRSDAQNAPAAAQPREPHDASMLQQSFTR